LILHQLKLRCSDNDLLNLGQGANLFNDAYGQGLFNDTDESRLFGKFRVSYENLADGDIIQERT
jgi:hypothetical protein